MIKQPLFCLFLYDWCALNFNCKSFLNFFVEHLVLIGVAGIY